MYRVVLVEDEPIVRIGLKNMVDWAKYNMQVIGDFSNGQEALEICLNEKPQLLITDIRMPVMDGLELIRQIRKTDRDMMIVILTCLDEFSYAQEATALGVSNYILKLTCGLEELDIILTRAKEGIEARGQGVFNNPIIDNSLMKEQVFFDFVHYQVLPIEGFLNAMNQLGVGFLLEEEMYLLMVSLNGYERFLEEDQSGRRLRGLIKAVIEEELDKNNLAKQSEVFCNHPGEILILLGRLGEEKNWEERFKTLFLSLSLTIDKRLNLEAFFQASPLIKGSGQLPFTYKQMRLAAADTQSSYPKKIREALDYISRNYQGAISLQEVADHLQISAGYLSRLFMSVMETSFTDCLNQERTDRAKKLLKSTDIPVYTIGEMVGIPNATYFIRVFKKHEGITPNEYRLKDENRLDNKNRPEAEE